MTLSLYEEKRIKNIEEKLISIQNQMAGAASEEMLNRLLVLCKEKIRVLTEQTTDLQTKVDKLIALAQKLQ